VCAIPSVERYDLVLIDSRLANGAELAIGSRQEPLMQAWPAEQMSAHADHCIFGRVQAYIALVQRFIVLLLVFLVLLARF